MGHLGHLITKQKHIHILGKKYTVVLCNQQSAEQTAPCENYSAIVYKSPIKAIIVIIYNIVQRFSGTAKMLKRESALQTGLLQQQIVHTFFSVVLL